MIAPASDPSAAGGPRVLSALERYLRLSGILLIAGLVIEGVTLYWSHPTAFLAFAFFGTSLVAAGIAVAAVGLIRWSRAG